MEQKEVTKALDELTGVVLEQFEFNAVMRCLEGVKVTSGLIELLQRISTVNDAIVDANTAIIDANEAATKANEVTK